jgi:iron complex transport system substrate-binding protein
MITILALVTLLLTVLLTACSGEDPIANPPAENPNNAAPVDNPEEELAEEAVVEEDSAAPAIEVVDALGNTLILDAPATRIVSLAPSLTEALFAIGAGDQVVGREDFANYPAEALELPTIGGTFGELNTEAILDLTPDLVMVAPLSSAEQVQSLMDVGLTVFMMPNPTTLEEMYDSLRIAAVITGHEAETEILIESFEIRVADIVEIISAAETTPLVFYELDSTDPSAPWTAGPGTFIDTLITMAGGQNLGASLQGDWVQVSSEELLALNPEIIILGDAIWGVTTEDVAARPGWDAIAAVANGMVYPFNDDLASRPGPRLVDGLEELAKLIHPELFE